MGRTQASLGAPPPSQRKDARAKKAKQTLNKDIPMLLKAYPRAQAGNDASELFVNPDSVNEALGSVRTGTNGTKQAEGCIRITCADSLRIAQSFANVESVRRSKKTRVTVLNMASPLRPGGGFLNGATSQEEHICMRTTLLPALREEFYRLPEYGGIFTPDVLVFRSSDSDAAELLKNERFFINVITAAMHRMPDTELDDEGTSRYANSRDRISAESKIRAVLQIAMLKNTKKLILGAWGCGAYGNPIAEIAAAFRTVLLGSTSPKAHDANPRSGLWNGMEIVFAIKDLPMAQQFSEIMGIELDREDVCDVSEPQILDDTHVELSAKIAELEAQIQMTKSSIMQNRLLDTLHKLQQDKDPVPV